MSYADVTRLVRTNLEQPIMYADWKSMPLGREKYHAYLQSDDWRKIRGHVLAHSCNAYCSRCRIHKATEVHHTTYAHVYNEWHYIDEELVPLCAGCHTFIHGHSSYDPSTTMLIEQPLHLVFDMGLFLGKDPELKCPLCNEMNSHVYCAKEVSSKNSPNLPHTGQYGTYAICLWGEACGHYYTLLICDHKGIVYMYLYQGWPTECLTLNIPVPSLK